MNKYRSNFFIAFFIVFTLFASSAGFLFYPIEVISATGPAQILSYQGRLINSVGNLVAGTYYFRFSIHNASSGGSQLWPAGSATPCNHTLTVREGVFTAGVGGTTECADVLNYD